MSVGEFTSSHIAASMDQDKPDGEVKPSAEVAKIQSDIVQQKAAASEVGYRRTLSCLCPTADLYS